MAVDTNMMEVNKFYAMTIMSVIQIGMWNDVMQDTFFRMVEDIGRAYCKDYGLPWPLPRKSHPKPPLSKVELGMESTRAFNALKKWCSEVGGINFDINFGH